MRYQENMLQERAGSLYFFINSLPTNRYPTTELILWCEAVVLLNKYEGEKFVS